MNELGIVEITNTMCIQGVSSASAGDGIRSIFTCLDNPIVSPMQYHPCSLPLVSIHSSLAARLGRVSQHSYGIVQG
jgi:hypothetical protein